MLKFSYLKNKHKINDKYPKNPRAMATLTGVTAKEFNELLPDFTKV